MKLNVYPIGEDGECLSIPSPVFVRLSEEALNEGWTLTLANQIKSAISRNIISASDADYPQWVQALHAVNSKRVLLVDSVNSEQYVFQEQPTPAVNSSPGANLVEQEVDNTLPGMINRREGILQTLQDLDAILLERLQNGS